MSVCVRFAPSPTGHVHIGNLRVAIFNWLFARHHHGTFRLRIEDTDRQRSTPQAIATLLDAMAWMGLDYDQEAVYQSARAREHVDAASRLRTEGSAFCAGENEPTVLLLDAKLYDPSFVTEPRDEASIDVAKGELTADVRCLFHAVPTSKGDIYTTPILWDALDLPVFVRADGTEVEGARLLEAVTDVCAGAPAERVSLHEAAGGRLGRIRFRRRYVFYEDLVMGRREKPLDSMRDQVIVRSDGSPVFHLANVLDDAAMEITHVLRGNDHVENTFRHLFLYKALGLVPPRFGHFPMIVNQKGKPYSKRDGDAYVGEFREKGVLPEALFNFLALCGWSPGDGRELLTRAEMVEAFSLDRVNASAARFDTDKLAWMNAQILRRLPRDQLLERVRSALASEGVKTADLDPDWLERLVALHLPHVSTLPAFLDATRFFFEDKPALQEKAVRKVLCKKNGKGLQTLAGLRPVLDGIDPWTEETLEQAITGYAEGNGCKMGDVAQPLRVAVTGGTVSRGIFEVLALLGREQTLARVDRVLAEVAPG